jgi:hypothetical protein
MVAVLLIIGTAPPVVAATRVKASIAPATKFGCEQETLPAAPTAGVVHVHPAAAVKEKNVVPAGKVSESITPLAGVMPTLLAVIE